MIFGVENFKPFAVFAHVQFYVIFICKGSTFVLVKRPALKPLSVLSLSVSFNPQTLAEAAHPSRENENASFVSRVLNIYILGVKKNFKSP